MDDLISRQAAINALHYEIVRRRISEDTNDDGTLDEFDTEAILRQLPSAQPTVDAIPISWLEDLHKTAQSEEADRMIDEIISLWEARKNE